MPDLSSDHKIEELYNQLSVDKSYFCEEFFIQTGFLGEVNPTSVEPICSMVACVDA